MTSAGFSSIPNINNYNDIPHLRAKLQRVPPFDTDNIERTRLYNYCHFHSCYHKHIYQENEPPTMPDQILHYCMRCDYKCCDEVKW